MSERRLTLADRKRLRDEAIVDLRHGFINRREFMLRATAAGVSAAFAGKIASAVAAPAPTPQRSRWAKQADTTITFIKGPHHPEDAQFWESMKQEFEAAHPDILLNPTFFNWATMDAELTAGYAGEPPDVVYLVDLLEAAGITEFPQTRDELVEAAKALTTDEVWGFQFRDSFTDYAHWDWLPYVHNDDADIMTADLTAQNLDPAAAAATQYLADMNLVHKVSPEAGAYDWLTGNRPLFEAGRIAILHDEYPQAVVWE